MSSHRKRRTIYQKGWYYEQQALKILRQKLNSFFYIKTPPNYPWDLTLFRLDKIFLCEVKYTERDFTFISLRKINRMLNYIKLFKNFDFYYIIIAFFGSKYNYIIRMYDVKHLPRKQIVLRNPKLPSTNTSTSNN